MQQAAISVCAYLLTTEAVETIKQSIEEKTAWIELSLATSSAEF